MIATIVKAEESITRKGHPVLRLRVQDDYEQTYFMYFSPIAWEFFLNMLRLTKTPLISKNGGRSWVFSTRHFKDKILSVERKTIQLGNRRIETLEIARRYWYQREERA